MLLLLASLFQVFATISNGCFASKITCKKKQKKKEAFYINVSLDRQIRKTIFVVRAFVLGRLGQDLIICLALCVYL
jgi:hypothetical protein